MEKKINLLVLTSMWPENTKDISGIFILDYVKAVQVQCHVSVLVLQLAGERKGLTVDELDGVKIYKYCVSKHYPSGIIKYLLYIKWFYRGRKLGCGIPGINLIHAHGSTLSGNLGLSISRSLKIPLVITEHANPFCKIIKKPLFRALTRYALQKANIALTVSEDLKKQVEASNIKPGKVIVTHNPVDVDLFKKQSKYNSIDFKNIIFVGRLEEYKGGLRVVQAFSQLQNAYPDWHLTLVGDGPEMEAIVNFINNSPQIAAAVVLKGQLSKEKVAEEILNSSFFVSPSRHETFGIVVAEAMAVGLPVIVSKGTAMDEFVDDSCGIFIDPDNIDEIAKAMKRMILTYDKYNAEKIRQQVVDRFGFEAFGKKLMGIYESVI